MRDFDYNRMPMRRDVDLAGDEWTAWGVAEIAIRIALVTVFIWAVVVLVRHLVKYLNTRASTDRDTPLEIAKYKLANGEMTIEAYEVIKKELK